MKTKVIAMGNRLMMDDGIAIRIVEDLNEWLEKNNFGVFIGETDTYSCADYVNDNDWIIVIDALFLGEEPGTVSVFSLKGLIDEYKKSVSIHDLSLMKLLAEENKNVNGYFIGIEVSNVDFGIELSKPLKDNYNNIKENIKKEIEKRRKN